MRVTLAPDASGHYITLGSINGQAIRFMVDTGATAVALGLSDARRLGINYRAGTPIRMRTANGIGQGYQVRLESVTLGNLRLSGIDAVVMEAELPIALLGMSFLNRTDMRQDAGNLVLTRRY
jgi:aspartyl protease family protein